MCGDTVPFPLHLLRVRVSFCCLIGFRFKEFFSHLRGKVPGCLVWRPCDKGRSQPPHCDKVDALDVLLLKRTSHFLFVCLFAGCVCVCVIFFVLTGQKKLCVAAFGQDSQGGC